MKCKKTIVLCLALVGLLSTGTSFAVNAEELTSNSVNLEVTPRKTWESTSCTLSEDSSWKSTKYYCASGDVFGAYAGLKTAGKVSLKIFYHSSSNSSGSKVASTTVSSGYKDLFYDVGKAGYYSVEVTNTGSSNISLDCGVIK